MLSIGKVSWGGERYYIDAVLSIERDTRTEIEFEPELGEPPGTWVGSGSNVIGLEGIVYPDELTSLLAGKDPKSQNGLGREDGRIKVVAFDLVFAAPKSVSLLYGLLDPELSAEVRKGHQMAMREALGYLERNAVGVRRAVEGRQITLSTLGAPAAGFLHRTSRALEPHLHTHVVMANLAQGGDGRWSGIDSRGLYYHAKTASFLYQAELRREMTMRLGVGWGRVHNGWADVLGVSREAVRGFSTRLLQIEADLERLGMNSPRAAHLAALKTRQPKEILCAMSDLRRQWRDKAVELGLGPLQLEKVLGHRALEMDKEHLPRSTENRLGIAWDGVAPPAYERKAFLLEVTTRLRRSEWVTRKEVIQACCQALHSGGSARAIELLSEEVIRSDLCRYMGIVVKESRFRIAEPQLSERMYYLGKEMEDRSEKDERRLGVDSILGARPSDSSRIYWDRASKELDSYRHRWGEQSWQRLLEELATSSSSRASLSRESRALESLANIADRRSVVTRVRSLLGYLEAPPLSREVQERQLGEDQVGSDYRSRPSREVQERGVGLIVELN